MPFPSPTSPTIADLQYNAYDPGGSLRTTAFVPPYFANVSDNITFSENVVLNLPGISYTIDTSDFLNTNENVNVAPDVTGPNQFSLAVSDTVNTDDTNVAFRLLYLIVNVNDTESTSENVDILKAGARNITVSDVEATSESVQAVRSG